MKFKKQFMGVVLAVCVVLGSWSVNGNAAYAKDVSNGDPSKYCTLSMVEEVENLAGETLRILNDYMRTGRIGYVNPSGSRGNMSGDLSKVEYWISGPEFANFISAVRAYMFPFHEGDPALFHKWDHNEEEYFSDDDWVWENGEKKYLKSISSDEMNMVIREMNAALNPIRQAIGSSGSASGNCDSGDSHTHDFVEATVQEATATSDEVVTLKCSICGQETSYIALAGTAVNQFIKDTIAKVEKASENESITIDTEIWTCFNKPVIEALKNRQDVTTTVNFKYKGTAYTFTIPAGYGSEQLDGLLDENGYCGFMYLVSVFGGQEIVK